MSQEMNFGCIKHKIVICNCYGETLMRYEAALKRIARGTNKERSIGMDTPPISVSRDHLRLWAIEALKHE